MERLVIELPEDLKKRLKTYCATNGKTMRDEVLAMICQTLESHEEATREENPEGQQETPIKTDSSQPPFIKTDSSHQIKEPETDIEATLRKALGLKEKDKQENRDFSDPLNIGFG
jgi:plasmid stability protein